MVAEVEALVEAVLVVAGWEATVPEPGPVVIVFVRAAVRDYLTMLASPATT